MTPMCPHWGPGNSSACFAPKQGNSAAPDAPYASGRESRWNDFSESPRICLNFFLVTCCNLERRLRPEMFLRGVIVLPSLTEKAPCPCVAVVQWPCLQHWAGLNCLRVHGGCIVAVFCDRG